MDPRTLDKLATDIATMDRLHLISLLRDLPYSFPMDFSDEFLDTISLERLRHIALGASMHRSRSVA